MFGFRTEGRGVTGSRAAQVSVSRPDRATLQTMATKVGSNIAPPQPLAADMADRWALDPSITFLNHGCFGARPKAVLEAQQAWRSRFESSPIELLDRRRDELIAEARQRLGGFIGASADNLAFVTNATAAINAVLRSLEFRPGDELLTTSHVYNAVRKTLTLVARRIGGTMRELEVPFPLDDPQQVIDSIDSAIGAPTRLLIVDHVTSPTAVVFPLAEIIELCEQRGVDVLVDGAHAPGTIDLDVESLKPAWYAGNLHKWVCAPPGAAFLWARPDRQRGIHPPVISHFLDEGFAEEFNWQGTRDISPWLCVDAALQFFEQFGWDAVRDHNHRLAVWVQHLLSSRWRVEPATPTDGTLIGSMTTVPLPAIPPRYVEPMELQAELWNRWQIEVPIVDFNGWWWLRASCQIYNRPQQYERLADAVTELLEAPSRNHVAVD